jgi:hypothetical protein
VQAKPAEKLTRSKQVFSFPSTDLFFPSGNGQLLRNKSQETAERGRDEGVKRAAKGEASCEEGRRHFGAGGVAGGTNYEDRASGRHSAVEGARKLDVGCSANPIQVVQTPDSPET